MTLYKSDLFFFFVASFNLIYFILFFCTMIVWPILLRIESHAVFGEK